MIARRLFALLALVLLATSAPAIDPEGLDDPKQQERYVQLIKELRCLKCQGETVADTPAMFAVDIRRQVRTMIQEGKSDQEIKQYLVDRYGEIILLRPRSPWLWIAPALFLLGGATVAWRVVAQRRRLLATDDSDPEAEEPRG
jgi:cytochrome c-type biogenesis protein CcmH